MPTKKHHYYDSYPLICITILFLSCSLITSFVAAICHMRDYMEISFFNFAASLSNFAGIYVVSTYIKYFLWFISAFFFFPILYVFNCNAKALNAQNMRFSPMAVISWHFIPIVCLWKPYQAMKEIWRSSMNPTAWETVRCTPILNYLWFVWIPKIA